MKRDIITIDDLSDAEMEEVFGIADDFLARMADPAKPYRIRGRAALASEYILSTLFFEPSTRTRFSFESAMVRLGGGVISSPSSAGTSAAKGESIADTVRVLENYADLIVIRHPSEGAARVAAKYSSVPVINAGDGSHEHPTQTLCDLYTLRKERDMKSLNDFAGLNIVLYGDLKNGRTVHSLVYALARLHARIMPMPANGLELPAHVARRLQHDYNCGPTPMKGKRKGQEPKVDAVYVTPKKPHERTLFDSFEELPDVKNGVPKIHVFYVTRLQTERNGVSNGSESYQRIDHKFLKGKKYKKSHVMHPLPRVGELGYDLDDDPRGVYFKQAAYGVSVRMALLTWLLDLNKTGTVPVQRRSHFQEYGHKDGINCINKACVTHLSSEQHYLMPDFWVLESSDSMVLRCRFCEYEYPVACVGRVSTREYYTVPCDLKTVARNDRVMFAQVQDAIRAGYTPSKKSIAKGSVTPVPTS